MDRYLELKKELTKDDYWLIKCVGMIENLDKTINDLEIERDILIEKITK